MRDLAVVLLLVDGPQVGHHQTGHTERLRPSAGNLDIGKIGLLADWVAVRGAARDERGQLLRDL